jgi:NADH dehydrogenase
MLDRLVTVFGASGFIGRYVVRALARSGVRVRAAVRNPATAHFLRPLGGVGEIQIVQANVRVAPTIAPAVEGASGVVNLVGILRESGPQRFPALHVEAAGAIAAAAAKAGVHSLTHVSAIGADSHSPSAYLRTKALGEEAVRNGFAPASIVRPSIVFGPEDEFFNRFAAIARLSPMLPLFGGGRTRFQPVFAGDLGEAIARTVLDPAAGAKIYEIGGPQVYTFRELMDAILKATQRRRLLVPLPYFAAQAMAAGFTLVPDFLMAPLITFDQVKMLKVDNIAHAGVPGLRELGIAPRALETVLPTYLWRFRKAGQFEVGSLA